MGSQNFSNSSEELYDSAFTTEMSNKMQVPKRIRVLGDTEGQYKLNPGSFDATPYSMNVDSKYEMKVPDRILVVGQDQHVGMKAPPHELVLENSILTMNNFPPIRVQTPPRSITVNEVLNSFDHDQFESEDEFNQVDCEANKQEIVLVADKSNSSMISEPPQLTLTSSQLTEEVFVLRQQIGRLHRRMATFEREQQQRQQRDALAISIGAVYVVWKLILWLTRSA